MSERRDSRLRIVVDTNVFVSSVILRRGNPYALRKAWQANAFVLVLSLFQRGEIEEVLNRPKIAQVYSLTLEERTRLLRRLDAESEFVEPQLTISVPLRDPKDALILGMALAGHVDYLVTGDKDLHALVGDPSLGKLKIVTVADFLPLLREHESNESDDDEDPGSPSAPPIPT